MILNTNTLDQMLGDNRHYQYKILKLQDILASVDANQDMLTGFSFSRGLLGASFLYSLYGEYSADNEYIERAKEVFERACKAVTDKSTRSFYLDISELGILIIYLKNRQTIDVDINDFLTDVDELISSQQRHYISEGKVGGFVSGAISMGLYFLHRFSSNPSFSQISLNELVAGIERNAIHAQNGYFWKTTTNIKAKEVCLTMPHGSAAIAIFLTKLAEKGISPTDRIHKIVDKTLSFIGSQKVDQRYPLFPDWLIHHGKGRVSLCYGDMGIGYAYLRAGITFSNEKWFNEGMQILLNCSQRRTPEDSRVVDAGVLFGATGLALMFNKVFKLTKINQFKETSDYWFDQVLSYANRNDGYAGFKAVYNQWHNYTNLSFCEGIIGIGAGLIASLRPDFNDFDELIWLF